MIVGVHRRTGPSRQVRDDLIGVHVAAGAGPGLKDIDRKLRVVRAPCNFSRAALDHNTKIAIEQPELHLNPALQVRIAEFLASMARVGKTLMIETHSEHIVNALRVLAAEDPGGELAAECQIVYIDIESGGPILRQLQVQANGSVPEWPRSFMGEAMHLSSRLLMAQERQRTRLKESV